MPPMSRVHDSVAAVPQPSRRVRWRSGRPSGWWSSCAPARGGWLLVGLPGLVFRLVAGPAGRTGEVAGFRRRPGWSAVAAAGAVRELGAVGRGGRRGGAVRRGRGRAARGWRSWRSPQVSGSAGSWCGGLWCGWEPAAPRGEGMPGAEPPAAGGHRRCRAATGGACSRPRRRRRRCRTGRRAGRRRR